MVKETQSESIKSAPTVEGCNPNALAEIDQRLRGYNDDLDAVIDAAEESQSHA